MSLRTSRVYSRRTISALILAGMCHMRHTIETDFAFCHTCRSLLSHHLAENNEFELCALSFAPVEMKMLFTLERSPPLTDLAM